MVSIMQDDTLYHEKHINDPGSCWIARINDDDDVNDGNDDDSNDDSDDDGSNDDDDSDDDGYNDDDDVDDDDNRLLTANLLKGESVDDGYRKRPYPPVWSSPILLKTYFLIAKYFIFQQNGHVLRLTKDRCCDFHFITFQSWRSW